jgi:hypothetical protein
VRMFRKRCFWDRIDCLWKIVVLPLGQAAHYNLLCVSSCWNGRVLKFPLVTLTFRISFPLYFTSLKLPAIKSFKVLSPLLMPSKGLIKRPRESYWWSLFMKTWFHRLLFECSSMPLNIWRQKYTAR